MLSVFQNSDDNKKLLRNRTAYIKEESGIRIAFKYYKVDREDIRENDKLKGIEMQETQMIIKTLSGYAFNKKTKIVIDNYQYSINSIYTEDRDQVNGMYIRVKPFKYLVLSR